MNAPVEAGPPRVRILGIDPGTRVLGYGVIDLVATATSRAPRIEYVECGVVRAPVDEDMPTRLGVLGAEIVEILQQLRPDVIALEQAFTGRNASSALKLGLCRGAVMLLSAQHSLPLREYAPAKIKRVVVGRGRATKQDVQQRVRLLCRLRREPSSDAADALAIALCHAHLHAELPVPLAATPRTKVTR